MLKLVVALKFTHAIFFSEGVLEHRASLSPVYSEGVLELVVALKFTLPMGVTLAIFLRVSWSW